MKQIIFIFFLCITSICKPDYEYALIIDRAQPMFASITNPPIITHYTHAGCDLGANVHACLACIKPIFNQRLQALIPQPLMKQLKAQGVNLATAAVDFFYLMYELPIVRNLKVAVTPANMFFHLWARRWWPGWKYGTDYATNLPMGIFVAQHVSPLPNSQSNDVKAPIAFGTFQPRRIHEHGGCLSPNDAQFKIDTTKPVSTLWTSALSPDKQHVVVAYIAQINTVAGVDYFIKHVFIKPDPFARGVSNTEKVRRLLEAMRRIPEAQLPLNASTKILAAVYEAALPLRALTPEIARLQHAMKALKNTLL